MSICSEEIPYYSDIDLINASIERESQTEIPNGPLTFPESIEEGIVMKGLI